MLRSLYSGISGMKVNQTKMDVIGNNIANVGTTGFKAGRVRFQDMLSQSVKEAMAPMANQGGINASQVGLGVQVASIDTMVSQGMMQPTGRNLDVGIDGEGFIMVGKGPEVFKDDAIEVNQLPGTHNISSDSLTNSNMDIMYSREGSFSLDNEGNLLTSDGYRVMGYSLTNDSATISATAEQSNIVSVGGFDFRFAPGSSLNGYNIKLGEVGPGTITSANVDKENKTIILNGDFSSTAGISDTAAKSAINKALSAAGIAQSLEVSGTVRVLSNISSSKVSGGADSIAPGNVSVGGFSFNFNQGSILNGYSIVLGKVNPGQIPPINASVNTTNKTIIIDGDFTTQNGITNDMIEKAINGASGLPSGALITVTGSPLNLSPSDNISGGVNEKTPTPATVSINGLTLEFGKTAAFNGKTLVTAVDNTLTDGIAKATLVGNTITIYHNSTTVPLTNLHTALNTALNLTISSQQMLPATSGTWSGTDGSSTTTISGGADRNTTASVTFRGLRFNVSYDNSTVTDFEKLNSYTIVLGDIKPGTTPETVSIANNTITINADFTNPSAINVTTLQTALNTALKTAPNDIIGAAGSVTLSGAPSLVNSTISSNIDGGEDLKSPANVLTAGLDFAFSPGTMLNGYTVQLGNINEGTKTSAEIDSTNKKIIINGDFSTAGLVTTNAVRSVVNSALTSKGIAQFVSVSGTPITINNVKSAVTNGGTPVQSIDNDGFINFVDATKELKSYDGSIKTLKIPDKVRVPGSDLLLSVRTFNISKEGLISGVLEDGRVTALGQLAIGSFKNPAGLTKLGKNLYHQSVNSGEGTLRSGIGTTGEDNSKGYGDMLQGMLEMSNVDLAEQFTDMIVTSRSFQASGKMISTGDEILQDIINLKR